MKKLKKYLLLILLLLLGFIFGTIFIFLINDVDKLLIKNEVIEFINIINSNKINIANSFIKACLENFIFYFIIWCSGFIFVILPISYFLLFYKGFILGFLLSTLLSIYKLKGILTFLIFIFPNTLLDIILITFFVFLISKFSKKFILVVYKDNGYDLKTLIKKYFLLLIAVIIVSIFLASLEIFVNYFLIKAIL